MAGRRDCPERRRGSSVNDETKTNNFDASTVQKLTRWLAAPVIEPSQRAARIQTVEKDIVLPLRLLMICILGYYFFFSGWFDMPSTSKPIKREHPVQYLHEHGKRHREFRRNECARRQDTQGRARCRCRYVHRWPAADWTLNHAMVLKSALVAYVILNAIVGAILIGPRTCRWERSSGWSSPWAWWTPC